MRAMVLDAAGSPLRRADLPRQTLPDDPPTGYLLFALLLTPICPPTSLSHQTSPPPSAPSGLPTSTPPASGQAPAFSSSCPAHGPTTLPATGASRPPALVTCCASCPSRKARRTRASTESRLPSSRACSPWSGTRRGVSSRRWLSCKCARRGGAELRQRRDRFPW